jgi:hypothetical protein
MGKRVLHGGSSFVAVWWRLRIEDELRHQDNEDNDE